MAFANLTSSTIPSYKGSIRYQAKEGKFFRVDRNQTTSGWENETVDITAAVSQTGLLYDLEATETGWATFFPDVDIQLRHHRKQMPPQPADPAYKMCIRTEVYLPDEIAAGDNVRQLSSNAWNVVNQFQAFHDLWENEATSPARKSGAEVVHATCAFEEKDTKFGTVIIPVWTPKSWVKRPAAWEIPSFDEIIEEPALVTGDAPLSFGADSPTSDDLPF